MRKVMSKIIMGLFFIFYFVSSVNGAEEGLAAWWKVDEGKGNIVHDSSGNEDNGEIYGATWVKTETGYGLLLDGKDDYVDCFNTVNTQLYHSLTISTWVNIPEALAKDRSDKDQFIIAKHDWNIGIDKSLVPFFYIWGITQTTPTVRVKLSGSKIPTDKWVHIVAVYRLEDEAMEIYIDGKMAGYLNQPDSMIGGYIKWPVMFGKDALEVGWFKGIIGETKIYSRALSSDEIKSIYRSKAKIDFITLHPLYSPKKIVADINFNKLGIDPNKLKEVELVLSYSAGKTIVESRKIKPKGSSSILQAVFNMKSVPSDSICKLKVILIDASDVQIVEDYKEFTWLPKELLKEFKWLYSKEGISEEVLAPWTPIEVDKQKDAKGLTVKVWGRSYKFDNSPFPTSIETKGNSILAKPMQITAKADGKNVQFEWKNPKIERQIPSIISFTQEGTGGGLNLSAVTQIEYDGMVKMDLKIIPQQSLKLEELFFEIPILSKYAKYFSSPDLYNLDNPIGFFPKDRKLKAFNPMIWFGDDECGLQWFCESDRDWYNVKLGRNIEIIPESEVVMLRLRLVDKVIDLKPGVKVIHELGIPIMDSPDKVVELSYTFGIQATPVKSAIKDAWDYKIEWGHRYKDGGTHAERFNFPEANLDLIAEKGVKTFAISNSWMDVYGTTITTPDKNLKPIYDNALKNLVKGCHKRGMQMMLYLSLLTSNVHPAFPLFNESCRLMPPNGNPIAPWDLVIPNEKVLTPWCQNGPGQDHLIDGIARMIEEYDIDGVYLDGVGNAGVSGCSNTFHGCGYIWVDGTVKKTYTVFAARQIMMRIYTTVKKYKPDGQVNFHNSPEMLAPVLSWVTSYWDGEHLPGLRYARSIPEDASLLKKMPLDYFRAEFMGRQWGVPAEFLNDYLTTSTNSSAGIVLSILHDVPSRNPVMSPIWKVMDEFGRKQAEWLPYWKNKEYVTVNPDNVDVYVSLYKHPKNGILAVVCNLSEKEANVKVNLNLKNLKLKDKLSASDSLDNKPVHITDGEFELSLLTSEFKNLKMIWVKEK